MTTVYTIGHSNHSLEHFLDLVRRHALTTLVDVRSRPYSRWVPHFQKKPLSRALKDAGIEYLFFGRELGGRPEGEEFYDDKGRVDYARRAQAADFQAGLARLIDLAGSRPAAILCAEEDPGRCHRRLLITPALVERAVSVMHIRRDGRLEPEHGPGDGSPQLSLFS